MRIRRVPAAAALALLAATALLPGPAAVAAEGVSGQIVFWRTSRLATPVSGRISAIPSRVGDRVKKGDVVAEIETTQFKADLAIAEAALANARSTLASSEATLVLEQTEFERSSRLKGSPAYSGARFDDTTNRVNVAKSAVEVARATIRVREAEVARREVDVRLARIEAPFDGVIVRHLLTVGGLVSIETPHILIMVDDKTPEIEVEIPKEQAAGLAIGREVEFAVGGGGREQAKVRAVLPGESPGAKTRFLRLDPVKTDVTYSDSEPVTVYLPRS